MFNDIFLHQHVSDDQPIHFCIGFKSKRNFEYPAPVDLKYVMQDFLEDYDTTRFHNDGIKVLVPDDSRFGIADGSRWDEFKFEVKPVDEKYYLSGSVGLNCTFSRKLRFCSENGRMALLGQSVLL